MSESAETAKAAETKQAKAVAATPSSSNPVQVTVSSPEVPATINLSVKPEVTDRIVVARAAVDSVQPDEVKLTAVPTSNQPTVQNQPTVTPVLQHTATETATKKEGEQQPTKAPGGGVGEGNVARVGTLGVAPGKGFQAQPDDFYRTIFYFSGMGRVIGSALAEGVYVDEKNRRNAIDPEEVSLYSRGSTSSTDAGITSVSGPSGELITSARNQAVNLSADFRRLQTLLESLPTFTEAEQARSTVTGGGVRIDEPIHGEIYFRSERPDQYQQQQQQQQQQQRTRQQVYIMDQGPVSSYQHANGHLINVPWNLHNNY